MGYNLDIKILTEVGKHRMKTIFLTGGGTAGHVFPCLALAGKLREKGFSLMYVGEKTGVERGLAREAGIAFLSVTSGKLRRYKSFKNVTDVFKVGCGIIGSFALLIKHKPSAVFAKGGYVALPVCVAAGLLRVPVVIHESDVTPGLANRLAAPFCKAVCVSHRETLNSVKKNKGVFTGNPIRDALLTGDRQTGLKLCGFNANGKEAKGQRGKPVLLVMGGSSGAQKINSAVYEALDALLKDFFVIHICGLGGVSGEGGGAENREGYARFGFAGDELRHLYACADFFVTRAGANSLNEVFALKKPALVIPLGAGASRGDQAQNAAHYEKKGLCAVLQNDALSGETLIRALEALRENARDYVENLRRRELPDAVSLIIGVIEKYAKTV